MNCEQNSCKQKAEYHIKNYKLCYDHSTLSLGYNINKTTSCKCCGLLVPKSKHSQTTEIREIKTKRNFSNEQSPYWEAMRKIRKTEREDGIKEYPIANPDVLSEDDHLFHRPLSAKGELQFEVIRQVATELSPQQQRVLQLCGFDGLSLREAAKVLNITVRAVFELLERAKTKIQERYQQIEEQEK